MRERDQGCGLNADARFLRDLSRARVTRRVEFVLCVVGCLVRWLVGSGLRAIHVVDSTAWEDPVKRAKIEQIGLLLNGALQGDKLVGLKMNVPESRIDALVKVLPSMKAPTVANLYKTNWFSVETVVSPAVVRDLVPKLCGAGAEDIIEYPLNKVI